MSSPLHLEAGPPLRSVLLVFDQWLIGDAGGASPELAIPKLQQHTARNPINTTTTAARTIDAPVDVPGPLIHARENISGAGPECARGW